MITVHVCSNVADKPFETFIDLESTTRFVAVPQGATGLMSVQSDEPCFLTVFRNDEEVLATPITEPRQSYPLAQFFQSEPPSHSRRDGHALLSMVLRPAKLAFSQPELEPKHPTLTAVLRKDGPEGEVLGTYEFVLLPQDEFERAHSDYHRSREPRVPAPVFTNDARSPKDAHNCWNCQAPINACGSCANCGCGQEQGC